MDIVHSKDLRRTVILMAWPAVLRTSLNMLVQMVDMVMVGSLGAVALAAVGLGNQVFFFSVAIVQALSIGTTTLVAQAVGRGDIESARRTAWQSLIGVLSVTSVLSVFFYTFSEQIISGIICFMPVRDSQMIALGSQYLGIISISIWLRFSLVVVNGIFQGAGDSRTPLYLMALSNLTNVLGNYALIYGHGPFPALGVKGAALATCGSGLLAGGLGICLLFTRLSPIRLRFDFPGSLCLSKDVIGRVLAIGIPSAVEQVGIHSGQIVYSMIVASLGSMAVAAQQILNNAYTMTYLPGIGFSLTAATVVGQFIGADKRKRALQSGFETAHLALILMSLVGIVFLFSPRAIAGLFTRETQVLEMVRHPLMILAFAQPAIAYIISFTGGLRGAGDTRWVMWLTLISTLGVRLLLTVALVRFGLGLTGVWLAMLVESYLRATFISHRFLHRIPRVGPIAISASE